MNFFSLFYGYFLINAFKIFGYKAKMSDEFLTYVGCIGALLNCLSRFVWAWLVDYFSFRYIYALLLLL
jgi:hypothetical protein